MGSEGITSSELDQISEAFEEKVIEPALMVSPQTSLQKFYKNILNEKTKFDVVIPGVTKLVFSKSDGLVTLAGDKPTIIEVYEPVRRDFRVSCTYLIRQGGVGYLEKVVTAINKDLATVHKEYAPEANAYHAFGLDFHYRLDPELLLMADDKEVMIKSAVLNAAEERPIKVATYYLNFYKIKTKKSKK